MKIAKETWVILAIGLADLATTILFINNHGAQEANPLFRKYWEMGLTAFVAAKMAMLVAPLAILEWARARRPRFVAWALRGAIVAYVAMYSIGYARLNRSADAEEDYARLEAPPITMMRGHPMHLQPMVQSIRQASFTGRPASATEF